MLRLINVFISWRCAPFFFRMEKRENTDRRGTTPTALYKPRRNSCSDIHRTIAGQPVNGHRLGTTSPARNKCRKMPLAPESYRLSLAHAASPRLARSHARTKRNDFPVGSHPPPPIYVWEMRHSSWAHPQKEIIH